MNPKSSIFNTIEYSISSPQEQVKLQTLQKYRHLLNSIPGMLLCGVSVNAYQDVKIIDILSSTSMTHFLQDLRSKFLFLPEGKGDKFLFEVNLMLSEGKLTLATLNTLLQPIGVKAYSSTGNPKDTILNVPENISLKLFMYIPYRDMGNTVLIDSNFPVSTSIDVVTASCIIEKYTNYTPQDYLPLTAFSVLGELHPTDSEVKFISYCGSKFNYLLELQKKLILVELDSLSSLMG